MGKWEDPLIQIIVAHIDIYQDLFLKHVPDAKPPLRIWQTSYPIGDKYWPQYSPAGSQKRIDLILIDKSEKHLFVIEAKLPKPIRSHGNCSKTLCPICQLDEYEQMLQGDQQTENVVLHKILLLFLNDEAKRWHRKHQSLLKSRKIALQQFPAVQELIRSVLSCGDGHGHMLFEKHGDEYKEKDSNRIWPVDHPNVFLPCEHGRYDPWPTSKPKADAFDILLRLKKRKKAVSEQEYLSMCDDKGAGRSNLKADGRFAFNQAQLKQGKILLEWP